MKVKEFVELVNGITNDDDVAADCVKFEHFKSTIEQKKAWSDSNLWQRNSNLSQLLNSLPGTKNGQVSKSSLCCLGLILCKGSHSNRVEALM